MEIKKKRETLADQLYGQILEQIVSGALPEGEKLPSEHALGQAFEVSRPVVREALQKLKLDRLIQARQGVGSFVCKRPPKGLVEYTSSDRVAGLMRLLEARASVEVDTARLAALRAGSKNIAKIEDALDDLKNALSNGDSAVDADFRFHCAIASASKNGVYLNILESIHELTIQSMNVSLGITASGAKVRIDTVLQEHQRIFDAICARDSDAAGLLMKYHLLQARQRITDRSRQF